MNLANLFFSFEGRIGRRDFWLGALILGVADAAVGWLFGVPLWPQDDVDFHVRLIEAAVDVVFTYPTIALAVKRLHDRNQPTRYAWVLVAAIAAGISASLLGLFDDRTETSLFGWVVAAFVVVVSLGFLVELGFRRGTVGDNRHGPDPLGS
jgi:uncharacterized membrane protein YhaH (DUF805 family)